MALESEKISLVAGRECGTCSLCCKVLDIRFMTPLKPAGKWCQHCAPGRGCAVWSARPEGCADFHCDWRKNALLSDEWRPDRCGFLINQADESQPFEIIVDPGRPNAWRSEPYYSRLKKASLAAAQAGKMIVVTAGARKWLMLPEEDKPIPPECFGGEILLNHEKSMLGERWSAQFLPPKKAS